ncbi:NADP oxidoreductase [Neorhizobium lilium]|uniref:NADP oxidoreductase n=1 Tax=Neorhizobium lilium TaxID=2503024 RepID=A0A3S3VTM7_9HYPH|nr:NADPH-dependent F420 reductase [Neorhizobium lilium]RWX81601.1 NADP oxidoreductase [Neorhizobium lilium]
MAANPPEFQLISRRRHMTTIGIIGAGNIGSAFAKALARNGIAATIANSRGPETLSGLVKELEPHISAAVSIEAAAQADIVLVAVPWSKLPAALSELSEWNGRIVIDANNPIEAPLFKPADLNGRLSTEIFTDLVPGARVVKAFNHLLANLLSADPHAEGGERVLFYSGDDAKAKAEVAALIAKLGFAGIDLGPISVGAKLTQFPGGPLPAINLVKFA